jgi:hypothetical protein
MATENGDRSRWHRSCGCLIPSAVIVILASVLGNLSFVWTLNLHWYGHGIFRELQMAGGAMTLVRIANCRFPDDKTLYYSIDRYNFRELRYGRQPGSLDDDPWKGEPVGFTVEHRYGVPGFEYATGDFWPPFSWQHPHLPFTRTRVSLFAIVVLGCVYPVLWYRKHRIRQASQVRTARLSADSRD